MKNLNSSLRRLRQIIRKWTHNTGIDVVVIIMIYQFKLKKPTLWIKMDGLVIIRYDNIR